MCSVLTAGIISLFLYSCLLCDLALTSWHRCSEYWTPETKGLYRKYCLCTVVCGHSPNYGILQKNEEIKYFWNGHRITPCWNEIAARRYRWKNTVGRLHRRPPDQVPTCWSFDSSWTPVFVRRWAQFAVHKSNSELRKIWHEPDHPGRNYCVHRGGGGCSDWKNCTQIWTWEAEGFKSAWDNTKFFFEFQDLQTQIFVSPNTVPV